MKTILLMIASLVACKNEAAPSQVPGPTMAAPSGFSPQTAAAAPPPAQPAPTAGGASCRAAAAKLVEMGERTKSVDEHASDCEREPWSANLRSCIVSAASNDALLGCVKIAFDGVPVRFTAKRSYEIGSPEMNTVEPRMFTQEGDEVAFTVKGMRCGMIIAKSGPAAAAFIVCDGRVLAGPLVEEGELRDAVTLITEAVVGERTQVIAGQMQASHDLTMSIMQRYPHGGGTWKVYDGSTGRPLYTTY